MTSNKQLSPEDCWRLLERQRHGHLAVAGGESASPSLRSLHHAILDNDLYFHGSPKGGKRSFSGAKAVFECVETIAAIPSHWIDPDRACPATTYYRSVQVEGKIDEIDDPHLKPRALGALMQRLQPEGKYEVIDGDSATYRRVVDGLLVFALRTEHVAGRANVGQRHGQLVMDRILRGLWQRGTPEDISAIETILRLRNDIERPDWLRAPGDCELIVHPTNEQSQEAAELLAPQYWNGPYTLAQLSRAQRSATAWVGARDRLSGKLVATSAALANATKHAWIYDVAVAPSHRSRGVGRGMLRLLLDHPTVRGVRMMSLRTLDAHDFYREFGFRDSGDVPNPTGATTMLLQTARV